MAGDRFQVALQARVLRLRGVFFLRGEARTTETTGRPGFIYRRGEDRGPTSPVN